jgi:hypothetical protein
MGLRLTSVNGREKDRAMDSAVKQYQQRDLGYPRTPTAAMYRITMTDGSKWDVPAQAIADSRDDNYSDDREDTIGSIRKGSLGKYDLTDWAQSNMNFADVEEYAVRVEEPSITDVEEGWVNGAKEIVGEI